MSGSFIKTSELSPVFISVSQQPDDHYDDAHQKYKQRDSVHTMHKLDIYV